MNQITVTEITPEQLKNLIREVVAEAISSSPTPEQQIPEMLTRQQLAEMLGVSLPFIHKQVNEGRLKATKFGRLTRFKRQDVEEFFTANPQFQW